MPLEDVSVRGNVSACVCVREHVCGACVCVCVRVSVHARHSTRDRLTCPKLIPT
jgi:hypothetical protein